MITGLSGLMLGLGLIEATAQNWVQNVNYALQAHVQVATNSATTYAINNKTLIQLLKGVSYTNPVPNPTITTTNGAGVSVTNSPFLPNAGHPTNDFPAAFTNSSQYVVRFSGTNYTNHIQFTNDVVLTEINTDPVSYQFTNVVTLTNIASVTTNTSGGTNTNFVTVTSFLFTNLPPAPEVLAVLDTSAIPTNGLATNTVFILYAVTNITTTSNVVVEIPSSLSTKAKLIVKSVADSEDFTFFIRDAGQDYDVTPFFNYNPHLHEVHRAKGAGFTDYLDISVDFNNTGDFSQTTGSGFATEGTGTQNRGPVRGQSGLFVKSVSATCEGGGQIQSPPTIIQPSTGKPIPQGLMVVGGRFSVNGGKIENPPATQ